MNKIISFWTSRTIYFVIWFLCVMGAVNCISDGLWWIGVMLLALACVSFLASQGNLDSPDSR